MAQDGLFPIEDAHRVTTPSGKVALVVSNFGEGVPTPVAIRSGGARGLLRFAGSSSETSIADQRALLDFAEAAFRPGDLSNLALMSGGTRITNGDHQVVMTILELPALIRGWHPSCRTLGSVPRTTETMSLIGPYSTFVPSDRLDGHTLAHPGNDMLWIVQINASQTSGYDLDIPLYLDVMDLVKAEGQATGLFVWSGGRVTAMEIREALLRGHPCGVVIHSGRIATDLFFWLNGGHDQIAPDNRRIFGGWKKEGLDLSALTLLDTPDETHAWLDACNFYT
ncbi:MAG TPA: hypothetical protein VM581_02810 [Magnetospirillaceae bacterium]|nr:hypothetical protein [Magnetospirillaceae bacterium]